MIITESFVWINYPKSASTFVRESLRELYAKSGGKFFNRFWGRRRWMKEVRCPHIRAGNFVERGQSSAHGLLRQVPVQYRDLPVVSSVRDPVERLVSFYHYGHWQRPHVWSKPIEQIAEMFPSFPNITLEDFLAYQRQFGGSKKLLIGSKEMSLGSQSHDLLRFFSDEHHFLNHTVYFESWDKLAQVIGAVRFLKTSSINSDLYQLLAAYGFPPAQIEFIRSKPKANVSTRVAIDLPHSEKKRIYLEEWLLNFLNSTETGITPDALEMAAMKR